MLIITDYAKVPQYLKDDLVEALIWSRQVLTNLEGKGHDFQISSNKKGALCCSFAKPSWSGDHCGPYMDSASEAVIAAVCEYFNDRGEKVLENT